MSRTKLAKPSPALLIAIIALVAALGGSAVAEVATTSLNTKETKKVKKIAKKRAKKQDKRNFPVEGSQIEDGAVTEAKIAGGLPPKAWANVSTGGGVTAGKGLTSADVTVGPVPFIFCISGVTGATAHVTGAYGPSGPVNATVTDATQVAAAGTSFLGLGCTASTNYMVHTFDAGNSGPAPGPFNIVLFD